MEKYIFLAKSEKLSYLFCRPRLGTDETTLLLDVLDADDWCRCSDIESDIEFVSVVFERPNRSRRIRKMSDNF